MVFPEVGAMSDQVVMSNARDPTEEEDDDIDKPVRAKPFSHLELIDLVEYMERKQYAKPPKDKAYRRKMGILQKISRKLQRKYGTQRTPRQIQKRYSDLKVRQEELLREIRNEIAQRSGLVPDAQPENTEGQSSEYLDATPSCSKGTPQPEQESEQEEEEETFTLQLEPIDLPVSLDTTNESENQGFNAGQVRELIAQLQCLKKTVLDLHNKLNKILHTAQNMFTP